MAAIRLDHFVFYFLCISSIATGFTLEEEIFIKPIEIEEDPIFKSNYRYDNNERNTSAAYDLWDKAEHHLFEWPGNITIMDHNFPLLRWGKSRSKYVQSPCENIRGMELAVYSHKYLHLTWGHNRLTRSYCEPLRVNRKYLPLEEQPKKTYEITVVDFDFVFDALLVVTAKGFVIRVGEIELNYRTSPGKYHRKLSYHLSQGLTQPVNKIVVQKCCSKASKSCPRGDTVVAYQESAPSFKVFISKDGGIKFKEIILAVPKSSQFLHSVVFYPNWMKIIGVHGGKTKVYLDEFSSKNGSLGLFKREKQVQVSIEGFQFVQTSRISNQMSFLLWDECKVWLGNFPDQKGLKLTQATFYIHSSIRIDTDQVGTGRRAKNRVVPHSITPKHCNLRHSVLSIGQEGKIGLLDKNNVFFYGVGLNLDFSDKTRNFALIGVSTDMSLLLPQKKLTLHPSFDRNNRPKLLYPPRYLRLPENLKTNLMDENYKKRLSMRIVKKTLFPSDFMAPFFQENLTPKQIVAKKYKNSPLAISKCMTSTLSVDGSLSQKPKTVSLSSKSRIKLTVTFYSYDKNHNSTILNFEPWSLQHFMNIDLKLESSVPVDESRIWMKYEVSVRLKNNYWTLFGDKEIFLLNLFTIKSLRCVHQPEFPIWIQIDSSFVQSQSKEHKKEMHRKDQGGKKSKPSSIQMNKEIKHCPVEAELDRQVSNLCTHTRTKLV